MKHILFCVLAYTVFTNICAHVKISKVGTRGDTEERHKSGISAITVSKKIAEVGKIFEYGMVAEINKIKKVGDKEKVGFLLKKFPFLKHTPKLAGTFGALGTMLSIVFSFIPKGDTPEIAIMKKEFSEMNTKLDIITSSLDESKKLIRESSQKAAYLQAEHKIIQAYKQLESLISNLIDLSCDSLKDCKYKKMKMVDNYKDRLNVRREVEMILRGTSQDSVFGTSLLILISEASGCYISKIKNFKSAVAALALKGSSASAFYDMITKGNYDMTSDVRRFQKLMFDLEKKSENIIFDCYKNINRYLFSDSIDLDQTLSQLSMQEANKHTLKYLCMKYSWMEFYVISVDGDSTPLFWANDSFHNELNSEYSSKSKMARNYIVLGSRNRVENSITKKERFRDKLTKTKLHYRSWFQSHYDQAIERLLNVMEYDKYLHNQFRTITVVPKYKSAIIGYAEKDFTLKQIKMKEYDTITRNDILAFRQCPNDVSCTSDSESTAIIASIYSKDQDISDCTSTCSHSGTCYFLPHTKTMACKCNVEHYGDDCSSTASDTSMALDLIKLIDISSKLPTLFDVSTQLGYVRETLQADLNGIQNSIQAIDDELTNLFDHFKRDLMSTLDLYGLMTQYGQIIRDLKYYYHILVERDGSTIRTNSSLSQILSRSRMLPYVSRKEKTELAKKIVQPTVLRRSLEYLSYLFVGRQDIPLISHQPLLFLIMKKHHGKLCTSEYKNILDNAYIQLAILEFEGYFLWMHALKLLNEDTSFVAKQYNDVVDAHERFLEYSTCQVRIQNSVNFEDCTNGYYIYSGLKKDVKCADGFYLAKNSTSLFVNRVVGGSSQMSSTMSSVLEIIGKPDVFPSYGRNTKAWSPNKCTNNDLIDVYFKDPLYIEEITIYETYNGGAVWKIEGVDVHGDSRIITQTSKKTIQKFQEARMLKINKKIDWSTSTLRIHIDCTKMNDTSQIDAVRITGRPVEGTCSWYNSFSCPPCKCDTIGSSSTSCTSDGQCRCKVGYYGKKCGNRDCLLGKWTSWSSCQCGPGKIKSRTRPIIQSRVGSGKICKKTSESISCNIKCLCKTGERGTVCEHKDCLVSDWGEWSACPLQNVPYSCNKIRHIYGERFRHRTITREKQNNGQACPSLSEKKLCKMLMRGGTKLRG